MSIASGKNGCMGIMTQNLRKSRGMRDNFAAATTGVPLLKGIPGVFPEKRRISVTISVFRMIQDGCIAIVAAELS